MTAEELEQKDQNYLREWEQWWSGLSEEERQRFTAAGIEGPEITSYTTKQPDFDENRVTDSVGLIASKSTLILPFLEEIWEAPMVSAAITATLGDLGSPFYREFRTGSTNVDPEVSPILRIVLEVVQSEPTPGMALAIMLKWFGSDDVRVSDRALQRIFGQTFQCVSICRRRLSMKLGCEIFAGKSLRAKQSYKQTNRKKAKSHHG